MDTLLTTRFETPGNPHPSNTCIKVLSSSLVVKFINPRGLALLEAESEDQVLGLLYPDIWPALSRQKILDAITGAFDGRICSVSGYCPSLKGTPKWWETSFYAVRRRDSADREIIGISQEVAKPVGALSIA